MSAQEAGVLLENIGLLNDLGFEAGDFGGGSLFVRACPGDLDESDLGAALSEIAAKLIENRRAPDTRKRELLLYTIACKAAVKAGSRMTPVEREALVRELMANPDIKFCPHGRPIVMEMTRAQLERYFKRA
jgi:DNA mismatch repair protein MutL